MERPKNFLDVWHSIYEEAIRLCNAIDSLPDQCLCGDADAHLEGRCPCCREKAAAAGSHLHQDDCTVLLSRLRADLAILSQDFAQIATPIENATIGSEFLELRREILLAAQDLHKIEKTVDRLNDAVAGFRQSCDVTELRSTKRRSIEVRQHFQQLNDALLRPPNAGVEP